MGHQTGRRRFFGYVRVSSAMQAATGLGIAAQEATIAEHCQRHGLHLVEVIRDDGVSAIDLARPGMTSMWARMVAGEADGVVVAKLDRLVRSAMHFAQVTQWCTDGGFDLVAVDMNIDTASPAGRLVATVMSAVAEWERSAASTRTLEAAAIKRGRGENMGLPGVRSTDWPLSERIFAERAAGSTWQAIADRLNTEQIPTIRGGSRWRVSAVQSAGGYLRPPARAKATELPALPRRRKTSV